MRNYAKCEAVINVGGTFVTSSSITCRKKTTQNLFILCIGIYLSNIYRNQCIHKHFNL